MYQILLFSFTTLITLFLLGYGLSFLMTPTKIKSFVFWLSPWYSIIFIIFSLTVLSLARVSVEHASIPITLFLIILTTYVLFYKKPVFNFKNKESIIIFIFIISSILFNLSPLLLKDKTATTISFGNNDVIVYTQTPEYLKDKSIAEYLQTKINYLKPAEMGVGNLVYHGYRWGTPIIISFFINLLNIPGYQYAYIFQVVMFSLTLPLICLLLKTLYKPSILGLIFSLSIFAFNTNALYMLYHNFAGQIVFWGLEVFLFIFFFNYFYSKNEKDNFINKWDYIIGLTIATLYMSYHEAIVFIFPPLIIFFIFRLIFKKSIYEYWNALLKIFFVAIISSSISITNSVIIDFLQAADIDDPIGWALFRKTSPFANPFEIMGFYSIHNFAPLHYLVAILLSLCVIALIYYGFKKIKNKYLMFSFIFTYIFFFLWTSVLHHNFFAYNRAVTYTLPLFIILFTIGIIRLIKINKVLIFIPILLLLFEYYSALKLNIRFITEKITVDKSLISLGEIQKVKNINEPIYTEQTLTGLTNYWNQVWVDYFIYPKLSYTPFNFDWANKTVPDNSLVLLSKPNFYNSNPLKIMFNSVVWENEYYQLVRLCNSDKCLLSSKKDLSKVVIGSTAFEDSLFLSGWDIREGNSRWVNSKESAIRLKTENDIPSHILIEALTLKKPQEVTVFIDKTYVGSINLDTVWKEYDISLNTPIYPGVHYITMKYSNSYRPVDLGINTDIRALYANYRKIAFY